MKTKLISYFLAILFTIGTVSITPIYATNKTNNNSAKKYTIELLNVSSEFNTDSKSKVKMNSSFIAKQPNNNELFGSYWAEFDIKLDENSGLLKTSHWNIADIRLAEELTEDEIEQLKDDIRIQLEKEYAEIQPGMLNSLKKSAHDGLKNDAPEIIYTNHPASLVIINGEPSYEDLNKRYSKIINAGAFIIKDNKEHMYYMYGGGLWFNSNDALTGWEYLQHVPNRITTVMRKHARDLHKSMQNREYEALIVPKIIVSTKPAELISTDGSTKYVIINNTNLAYAENTDADLFKDLNTNKYYTLFSGRWFTSYKMESDWSYIASDNLPADFAKIPDTHKKSNVLVSVAGTQAAEDALKDAAIPYVQKKDIGLTLDKNIEYNGEPEFVKIEGTNLEYAINTESPVIKWNSKYYLVDDAVWYSSNSPFGAWQIATQRPNGIENIPASNPLYNIKYVYIYKKTKEVVYTGFTSGYTGSYIYGPTVVFGTGFYYSGWHGHYYYHYPMTYGYGFYYDPFYGWIPVYSPYYRPSFYWHWHRHYWYGYRPPYYRPPHHYPPRIEHYPSGNKPIHGVRPEQPIHRPGQPSTLPSQPSTRPGQPGTLPSQPSTRPVQPSTLPSRPSVRPTQPSTRPSQPAVRPSQPATRPSAPATRPSAPATRPAPSQMR